MGRAIARGLNLLTTKQVAAAKPGTAQNDGGGLHLRVSAVGTGRWVYRFKLPGQKQREMGLGTFGAGGVTLALAREKATAARELVARGLDPITEAEKDLVTALAAKDAEALAEKSLTFGAYAREFLSTILPRFENAKHRYQWRASFDIHAALLAPKQLAAITRQDVLDVLKPIWDSKHVTASRVRGRLENLFDHAIQNGVYPHDNPARWSLFSATLSSPRRQEGKGHQPAMPRAEIAAFVSELRKRQATSTAALEFVILTACRSGEVRLARWNEFDLKQMLWRIPAARMKMRREHIVPLTHRMVEILEAARQLHLEGDTGDELVFPGQKTGKPLSDMTLRMIMRRMNVKKYTVHGFRSGFRDWVGNDTEFPRELAEEALAHSLVGVERAYRREQAVERRRVMMGAWEDFVNGKSLASGRGKVLPFKAAVGEGKA